MATNSTRRVETWQDLAALLTLEILLVVVIYSWPLSIARIVLSLICLLFSPGYVVLAVLLPGRYELENAGRVALSFGISVATLVLIGFILNYSPWGMRLEAILVGVFGFVVIFCTVAFWRRSRLASDAQFQIDLPFDMSDWGTTGKPGLFLLLLLALAAAGTLGAVVYAMTQFKIEKSFTEFYVLGSGGVAQGYPREVAEGEPITLIIGIVNHEHGDVQYHVERGEDVGVEHIASPYLGHEEMWEQPYTFTLTEPGENRKVTFLLYKGDDEEPYRSLHLWITVKEKTSAQ
jgi:uncharacterized membrane protein